MDGNTEPSGCTYTFSITYKDGKKEIVKADSGTETFDRLLQFALDDDVKAKEQDEVAHSILKKAPSLQKINYLKGYIR